jgi:hypothetical protein
MEDNTDYSNIPLAERRKLAIEFAKKAISALTSLRKITSTTAGSTADKVYVTATSCLSYMTNLMKYLDKTES